MQTLGEEMNENYGIKLDKGQFYALVFGYNKKLKEISGNKFEDKYLLKKKLSSLYGKEESFDETKEKIDLDENISKILLCDKSNEEKLKLIQDFVVSQTEKKNICVSSRNISQKSEKLNNNKALFMQKEGDFCVIKKCLYRPLAFAEEMAEKTGREKKLLEKLCLSKIPEFEIIEDKYLELLIEYACEIASFKVEEKLSFIQNQERV